MSYRTLTLTYGVAAMLFVSAQMMVIHLATEPDKPVRHAPQIPGFVLPQPKALASFRLDTADGIGLSHSELRGQWSLIALGYLSCPDVCPTTLATLRAAIQTWSATHGSAVVPRIYFVSVDPERDTPFALQRFVEHFDSRIVAATGEPGELMKLARSLGTMFQRQGSSSVQSDYAVAHPASLYLVNPRGELGAIITAPYSARLLADAVNTVIAADRS